MSVTADSRIEADDLKVEDATPAASAHGYRRFSLVEEERAIEFCECVMDIVAALFNVSGKVLRTSGRSTMSVSRVRQIGMYVAHVILGLNMTEVGRGFGRDRTTVQHACHLIEDMRDDEEFDRIVCMTERVARAALLPREAR